MTAGVDFSKIACKKKRLYVKLRYSIILLINLILVVDYFISCFLFSKITNLHYEFITARLYDNV